MGYFSARLFTWLQDAEFYRALHRQAVDLLPLGAGRVWLDVGCGPGLVTRLAAAKGYDAIGVDADEQMIRVAHRIARRCDSSARFVQQQLAALDTSVVPAEVVSASSFLAVVDDVPLALSQLWRAVRPGGQLLIIEPLPGMTLARANRLIRHGAISGKGVNGLRLWAAVRQGAIRDHCALLHTGCAQFVPLLDEMVGVWLLRKEDA
jgi:SAM-dependent methyltransferase